MSWLFNAVFGSRKRTRPDDESEEQGSTPKRVKLEEEDNETLHVIRLWSEGKHTEAVDAIFTNRGGGRYLPIILTFIEEERPGVVLSRFLPGILFGSDMVTARDRFGDTSFQLRRGSYDHSRNDIDEAALRRAIEINRGTEFGEHLKYVLLEGNYDMPRDENIRQLREIRTPGAQLAAALHGDEDRIQRVRWAADRNHAGALMQLWNMTRNDGTTTAQERMDILERLEKLGDPAGITNLGKELAILDPPKAWRLFTLGAMLGDAGALKVFAEAYSRGVPGIIAQDVRTAQKWYAKISASTEFQRTEPTP
jgi:hypothetical protein